MTDALKAQIDQTLNKSELEDLYLPYKPKRRTKAMIAREKGLEPLADYLCGQEPKGTPLETFAASFVNVEKGVASAEDALEGARHIVAETISDNADIRKLLRAAMFDEGVIVCKKAADAVDEQQKFKMYYDYREPVKQIPSHRMLAIRRGEAETVLYFLIELDPQRPLDLIRRKIHKQPGDWTPHLNLAAEDAWKRLLSSSITGEVRLELKQRADADAIQVFRENLQNLLLAPPAGQLVVLGLDPGIRTGCKIAATDREASCVQQASRRSFAVCSPLGSHRAGLFVPMSKRIHFLEHGSLRSRALTIRGEKLANILLLACCYQKVSMGRHR